MRDDNDEAPDGILPMKGRPPKDVMALTILMKEWLQGVICDAHTGIDSGMGFNASDLWIKMGGKEVHIRIQETAGEGMK